MYGRMKRVTDPLNEKVKARIVGRDRLEPAGCVSSGSEHSATGGDDDVFSPSLTDIFLGLFNDADEHALNDSETEGVPSVHDSSDVAVDLTKSILLDHADVYKNVLLSHVTKALQVFACVKTSRLIMQRNVMAFLRGFGYDVAICKTKWEGSGGLAAGNLEFIDLIRPDQNRTRYFVGLHFASEFEIARPTDSFQRLVQHLPTVFVGKGEELKQILKVTCDAAKRSLKSRGLYVPPWRKHRFMRNKWFGQYRRTTNLFPATFSSVSPMKLCFDANCRAVGFDAAVKGGGILLPAAARTG